MKYSFIFLAITCFFSCKDHPKVDVSHIKAPVEIIRMDKLLADAKTMEQIDQIGVAHPAFMSLYLRECIGATASTKDSNLLILQQFLQDSMVKDINVKVAAKFRDDADLKAKCENLYQHMKYYFPKIKSTPKIYTFISAYAFQLFTFEDNSGNEAVAIGLDMFLHPEVDYKAVDPDNTSFSDYITRSWNPDHITKKLAEGHVKEMLGNPSGFKLIDIMIHNGKELYIIDQLLPMAHDSIIHEYTDKQLKWCMDNETAIWSYFIDKKLFYESTPSKINRYVSPSPNSPDMPSEAPGRTANYLGYQIVKAYMNRYPKTTMTELIAMHDSQLLLDKSKYKPKR